MKIEIDSRSGFCFGVINAIKMAEQSLDGMNSLYCLGDIVHNEMEVKRLEERGLRSIDHNTYFTLKNCKVLLRAHGEPPEIYEYAKKNGIELIDATCPVVIKLQQRVKKGFDRQRPKEGQIAIFGKEGHAEVVGLSGQTHNEAIIIENINDLRKLDLTKPVEIFSQTTKSIREFREIADIIKKNATCDEIKINDTICRQVANRVPGLIEFSQKYDVIIFVSGEKSSNGKILYQLCKENNPRSYFVSDPDQIEKVWFKNAHTTGICGATSTPQWLMENVAEKIVQLLQ